MQSMLHQVCACSHVTYIFLPLFHYIVISVHCYADEQNAHITNQSSLQHRAHDIATHLSWHKSRGCTTGDPRLRTCLKPLRTEEVAAVMVLTSMSPNSPWRSDQLRPSHCYPRLPTPAKGSTTSSRTLKDTLAKPCIKLDLIRAWTTFVLWHSGFNSSPLATAKAVLYFCAFQPSAPAGEITPTLRHLREEHIGEPGDSALDYKQKVAFPTILGVAARRALTTTAWF